jgi:RHS repeat-associated protein
MSMTLSAVCASRSSGKERDAESGLDYFGARYNSSSMGRWMSPDWADKPEAVPYSSLDNPQSLNLYGYVLNNPLSHADADGHCCEEAWSQFAGAVGGVLNIVPQSINLINSAGNAALSLTSTSYRIPMMDEIQSDAHASAGGMAVGQAAQMLVPVGDLAEGAQITRNAMQGAAGEAKVGAELVSEGKTIVGSQVGVQTDKGLRVVDHMVQDGGKLSAVEVKTGGATRNASQLAKDASMESNGGKIVGKNAPANLRGQTVKMPTEVRKPQQ